MRPTIGRIIYYMTSSGEVRPAIITNVEHGRNADILTITVFGIDSTAEGVTTDDKAHSPEEAVPGQWWWPRGAF